MTIAEYPLISSLSKDAYPWSINISLESSTDITFLNSPSHETIIEEGKNSRIKLISLNPTKVSVPNKNFDVP